MGPRLSSCFFYFNRQLVEEKPFPKHRIHHLYKIKKVTTCKSVVTVTANIVSFKFQYNEIILLLYDSDNVIGIKNEKYGRVSKTISTGRAAVISFPQTQ